MAIITIDTSKEFFPSAYARIYQKKYGKNCTRQMVSNWIKREKVETRYIPELEITLVVDSVIFSLPDKK